MQVSTQIKKRVNTAINAFWDALLPTACTLCGDPADDGEIICAGCQTELPLNRIYCPRCAHPMPTEEICGECLGRPPAFDHTLAPLLYAPPADRLISQLKYGDRLAAGRTFARLLERHIRASDLSLPEAVMAVPLHGQRLKFRGFNQSQEIARPLAKALNLPLLTGRVIRHKATPTQTGLSGRARRKNLRGAFSVATPLPDQHLALVDDVMTTGSTAGELAATFKKAGAARVDIWVVARVPHTPKR
ncbi:MAG: ComF family protein [Gammaproteobacteria bacterium]